MPDLVMPSLGADMERGRLLEWLVTPGQAVARGDIVAVVDTDKAEIEIETFDDGVIGELLVEPGTEVPVGAPLATITAGEGAAAEAPAEPAPEPPAPEPPAEPAPSLAPAAAPIPAAPTPAAATTAPAPALDGERIHASPLARRVAADLGVDLHDLHGTGPHGSIVRADVEVAAHAPATVPAPPAPAPPAPTAPTPPPAPAPDALRARQAAMREAIGALMARSAREIPHYHLGSHIDLARATAFLAEHNRERPVTERVVPAALLLKATALAAREAPAVNGHWQDGAMRPSDRVHLGVAIALRGGGLVAPAIHDADTLGIDDLMAALRDLVERARRGRLRNSEMTDATLTVTNLGERGVETVHGVIYPPQVALVGFGRIVDRPWAVDGMLAVRPIVHATLAADHRASDGHTGGLFLAALDHHLQEPDQL